MYNKENLAKLKKMDSLAPQVMKAFWAFDKAAVADGAIPVKYKELIAVAVASPPRSTHPDRRPRRRRSPRRFAATNPSGGTGSGWNRR